MNFLFTIMITWAPNFTSVCDAELLKRLDDVARAVRLKAAQVLAVLFLNLPEGYDVTLNTARLQDLCKDALIFLDDPDEQLQDAVCGKSHICLLYTRLTSSL